MSVVCMGEFSRKLFSYEIFSYNEQNIASMMKLFGRFNGQNLHFSSREVKCLDPERLFAVSLL